MKLVDIEQVYCSDCEGKDVCEKVTCDVKKMPTIDAVPVVRCKDCKYARKSEEAFDFDGETPLCEAVDMMKHIAAIEDILGDEYDLDRLRELAQADREGRCVVLPCKVGDTVWAILDGAKYARECKVDFVNIGSFGTTIVFMTKDWLREQYGVAADAFGKTVFLTREEAKAALEAMKDGD